MSYKAIPLTPLQKKDKEEKIRAILSKDTNPKKISVKVITPAIVESEEEIQKEEAEPEELSPINKPDYLPVPDRQHRSSLKNKSIFKKLGTL